MQPFLCSLVCAHHYCLLSCIPGLSNLCLIVTHLISNFLPVLLIKLDLMCALTTNESIRNASFFLCWKLLSRACTFPVGIRILHWFYNQAVVLCP